MTELTWPWQFDRRVRWLLELTMDEDERIRFFVEGMDAQLMVALDERLLVVKPGFVRGTDFGGMVASIYYHDITAIKVRGGLTNWVVQVDTRSYQVNESHAQSYQGNRVMQAKDFWLSNDLTSMPITRGSLRKHKPHLFELEKLVQEAKEA